MLMWIFMGFAVVSILLAMLIVSISTHNHLAPHHAGHYGPRVDTHPANNQTGLFSFPLQNRRVCTFVESQLAPDLGRCGMMNNPEPAIRSSAIVAISAACLFSFFTGNPLATM